MLALTVAAVHAAGRPPTPVGKSLYTRCNIWYENPKNIPSTNFHKGGRLPAAPG